MRFTRSVAAATVLATLGLVAAPSGGTSVGAAGVPNAIIGLTSANSFVTFDAAAPTSLSAQVPITGLSSPTEKIVGMDQRPATGQIIAVGVDGTNGRMYVVNTVTGVATPIGTAPFATNLPAGGSWTVDFNPAVDRVRFVHEDGTNLRLNPNNGALAGTDTPISGVNVKVLAGAYDRNDASTSATTLYGIDAQNSELVTIGGLDSTPSPNLGVVQNGKSLGFLVDYFNETALDIAPAKTTATGLAYMTASEGAVNSLYLVDLGTGAASKQGLLGDGTVNLLDISVVRPVTQGASQFTPTAPTRILDTRDGTGAPKGTVKAQSSIDVTVTGGVVPATATAVVINLVGVDATADGFLTVYPTGGAIPTAANQNLVAGQTRSNLVTAKVVGGKISIFSQSGADLVADIYGYYAPATSTAGRFTALPTPKRALDTRNTGKVAAGTKVDVQITGDVTGVPQASAAGATPVVAGASSVIVNVTAVDATAPGFVTGYATGSAQPTTAILNVDKAGQVIGNLAVLPLSADGKISLFSQSGTHFTVDVVGWFSDTSGKGGYGGLYVPVTPSRVLDTRNGTDASNSTLGVGGKVTLAVAGQGGIPANSGDGTVTVAGAVVANVTAVQVKAPGYLTVYPSGSAPGEVSSLYADTANQIIPSLVVTKLGPVGNATIFSNAGTDVVFDVAGWYTVG